MSQICGEFITFFNCCEHIKEAAHRETEDTVASSAGQNVLPVARLDPRQDLASLQVHYAEASDSSREFFAVLEKVQLQKQRQAGEIIEMFLSPSKSIFNFSERFHRCRGACTLPTAAYEILGARHPR